MSGKLRFHSFVQQGLALSTSNSANDQGIPTNEISNTTVSLKLQEIDNVIEKKFSLCDPGDVYQLDISSITRIEPRPNTQGHEPNFFPFLEFSLAAIPWMFSPVKSGTGNKICPWFGLVALEETHFELRSPSKPDGNRSIYIRENANKLLPNIQEAYAWAHVQENFPADNAENGFQSNPERFKARVLCAANLRSSTNYHIFLVPLFESGRRTGLGLEKSGPTYAPAWIDSDNSKELPIYFSWSFRTGDGDFESLLRKIAPYESNALIGYKNLDISKPGSSFDVNEPVVLDFQGALSTPLENPAEILKNWDTNHKNIFQAKLENLLKAKEHPQPTGIYNALVHDPIVSPPLYGSWQSKHEKMKTRNDLPPWMDEINFTPTNRAAAGLGAKVIRKNQEEFMADAWEAARNAETVQKEMRKLRFAFHVSQNIHERISKLSDVQLLNISSIAHKKILGRTIEKTFFSEVRQSSLGARGLLNGSFRRMATFSQRKLKTIKNNYSSKISEEAVIANFKGGEAFAEIGSVSLPRNLGWGITRNLANLGLSFDSTFLMKNDARSKRKKFKAGVPLPGSIDSRIENSRNIPANTSTLFDFANRLKEKLNPKININAIADQRITGAREKISNNVPLPKLTDVSWEYNYPLYKKLYELNPEAFLPGVGKVPENSVALLTPNKKFIEAFLVGANHEMSRELAWRAYPARLHKTWFKKFWDFLSQPTFRDIEDISGWTAELAKNSASFPDSSMDFTCLLLKAELLDRYPGTNIYAVKAKWQATTETSEISTTQANSKRARHSGEKIRVLDPSSADNIKLPILKGELEQGIQFLGFPLKESAMKGTINTEDNAGWFIVFEEHTGEPRFGLDQATTLTGTKPDNINDLSWGNFAATDTALNSIRYAPLNPGWDSKNIALFDLGSTSIDWGSTSAAMAKLTFQKPFRLAIHCDALLKD